MSALSPAYVAEAPIVYYPDSDGKPMSDNTLQFQWIVTIKENLDACVKDFVAGDLLWYPVEGQPTVRQAPDVLVALGRPKGYRGSYQQWKEGGIAPQVVWEVLSPGNTLPEMYRKLLFYEHHGVLEYYVYDPDARVLSAWLRDGSRLIEADVSEGFVSPALGVHMRVEAELELTRPDGQRFLTFQELMARAEQAEAALQAERARAEQEHTRAEQERTRAEQAEAALLAERAQVAALMERLRALGQDGP